jgi:hypothetical protein
LAAHYQLVQDGKRGYVTEPEQILRDQLVSMIEDALDEMLRGERVEPGLLGLIAGADAAIRALDRRQLPDRR